ncbi:hypothetical protein CTEN210_11936 [Chaetoceros tenuissimus]|uniref:Uncharacterized protein n=1 Tax=Chaetoceros tenuissimus TaxID=426638 RepID=A0AAD3H9K8_9STRA|nr:hypothetical protein CTEN210_11936 [Chaetoceros tenuissimus]
MTKKTLLKTLLVGTILAISLAIGNLLFEFATTKTSNHILRHSLKVVSRIFNHDQIQNENENSAYLTMYGDHRVPYSLAALPKWLQEYVIWNQKQRRRKDTENNKTNRIFCLYWDTPAKLESFLQVPKGGLNWTCPKDFRGDNDAFVLNTGENLTKAHGVLENAKHELKSSTQKYIVLWHSRSTQQISVLNKVFYANSYKGQVPILHPWMQWSHVDSMEHIFRVMFMPIPAIARNINATMAQLGLVEGNYTSVHLRARYPTGMMSKLIGKNNTNAHDKGNHYVKFEGAYKGHLMSLATNALECGLLLDKDSASPIFFIADSTDLVHHVTTNNTITVNDTKSVEPVGFLEGRTNIPHFGFIENGTHTAEDFYPLFEDLLIVGGSKCVAFGIGSFGAFGAGLAGNRCRALHQQPNGEVFKCPNNRTNVEYMGILNEMLLEE